MLRKMMFFMYFKIPVSLFSMSCQTCYLKYHEVMKKIRAMMLAKKDRGRNWEEAVRDHVYNAGLNRVSYI